MLTLMDAKRDRTEFLDTDLVPLVGDSVVVTADGMTASIDFKVEARVFYLRPDGGVKGITLFGRHSK